MARVPCKNCTRRTPGCHGRSPSYSLYKVLSKYEKAKDHDDIDVQSYIMINVRKIRHKMQKAKCKRQNTDVQLRIRRSYSEI